MTPHHSASQRRPARLTLTVLLGLLVLTGLALVSLMVGSRQLPPHDTVEALLHREPGVASTIV